MLYRKIKSVIQLLLIVPLALLLCNDALTSSVKLFGSTNENLNKTVEETIIATDQKELALSMKKQKTATETKKEVKKETKKEVKQAKAAVEATIKAEKPKSKKVVTVTPTPTINVLSTFKGSLTAYVGNCEGCSGITACKTRENKKFNAKKNTYYTDYQYSNVRVVATSSSYKCGSIIRFKLNGTYITAVALDRGGAITGNKVDLLTSTVKDARLVGSRKLTFEVLRKGW